MRKSYAVFAAMASFLLLGCVGVGGGNGSATFGGSPPAGGGNAASPVAQIMPPQAQGISPNAGPGAGTAVVITGSNFQQGATVSIGGTNCTSPQVLSSTQISCTTGARTVGTVDVVITNSDGQTATLSSAFTYSNFYYVTNQGNGTVSGYLQSPTTGMLTELTGSPFATGGSGTYGAVIDPTNKYLWAINYGSSNLTTFSINQQTGVLSKVGSPVATGSGPACVAITPDGKYLYVSNYASTTIFLYSVNSATGTPTYITSYTSGSQPNRVIVEPKGRFLFANNLGSNNVSAWTINGDGSLNLVGDYATGTGPDGMATDLLGQFLYVGNSGSNNMSAFLIDQSTGALTANGTYPLQNTAKGSGVDVQPNDGYVFATSFSSGTVQGFSMNSTTGVLTALSAPVNAKVGANDFEFSISGTYSYVVNSTNNSLSAFSIDARTGAATVIQTLTNLSLPGMSVSTK